MQYLRDDEDEGKDMTFSPDLVQKIQQDRYEEIMLKNATSRQGRGRGSPPTTDNNRQQQPINPQHHKLNQTTQTQQITQKI
ncbi:hypothetical protein HMPREF1544_04492 [Mucor circinelloides 1006PhL]|uniref:Uncharacterized protein n=1 Tax=Mucor circinelloides f. circinelloides (strain 1006PhL) TaxID=1220926 RepID=S2JJR1_MUCC1|nr:hypothetical protein HMPREF1544_04492 [Mucor circinelloides 1006PhL]